MSLSGPCVSHILPETEFRLCFMSLHAKQSLLTVAIRVCLSFKHVKCVFVLVIALLDTLMHCNTFVPEEMSEEVRRECGISLT